MNKKINILFLEWSLPIGGAERMLYEIISRLDKTKFNPIVCCLYDTGIIGEKLKEQGFTINSCLIRNRFDFSVFQKLNRIIHQYEIDIVYTTNAPITQLWSIIITKLFGIKSILAYHTHKSWNRKIRKLFIDILSNQIIDKIIALSNSHRNHLITKRKANAAKIKVIRNGISINSTNTTIAKNEFGILAKQNVIGMVAYMNRKKAFDIFLQSAKIILKKCHNTIFMIIGDGPLNEELQNFAQKLGIMDHIKFLGERENAFDIISIFDIGVLSSRYEALPIVLLEYMAQSKPVVATDVGSVSEIVDNEKTGFLVEPENPQALADSVMILLKDRNMAIEMGKKGKMKVQEQFTVEKMVHDTELLFDSLMLQS